MATEKSSSKDSSADSNRKSGNGKEKGDSKTLSGKRNVLITGATSTVGRQLSEKLMFDPRIGKVLAVAVDSPPYYFQDFSPDKFTYMQVNILKYRELTNLFLSDHFKESNIDTICHLASLHRPSLEAKYSHQLNVIGTKNLLEQAIECGCIKKFIYKSSANVYKILPHNDVFLTEDAELNMDTDCHPSVKDQVDAELLVRTKMDNPTMKIVVLRPTGIIGRNIHSYFNQFYQNSVCFKPLGFNPMVNLIHVNDVMRAMQQSIHLDIKGVFNLAGKETAPLSEFARLGGSMVVSIPSPLMPAATAFQKLFSRNDFDYRVNMERLKYSLLLDTAKAKKMMGFEPTYHVKFE